MFLPINTISLIYIVTSVSFGFVSAWFGVETFAALYLDSKKHSAEDISPKNITYILPAYLNNEAVVLDETLKSYCEMVYNGNIRVMVVYNSKGDMRESENFLHREWDGHVEGNVTISIVKNENSTSKAENVNYGISLVRDTTDYIAIMDADHQPAKDNAAVAMTVFEKRGYDILQGACTIRNQENFLSTLVSVEFADMYSVGHQGRLQVFNLGIFGGSNGYWKAGILKEIKMDGSMLTEDIDSSIRATLAGYKIGYSGDVISSELSPLHEKTLQKQRLRWAQGWAQVSSKYVWKCVVSKCLTVRQKLGLVYLLAWREFFPYMTFWPLFCVAAHYNSENSISFALLITLSGIIIFMFGICRVAVTRRVSKGPIRKNTRAFITFAFCNLFYSIYLNYIQVCAHGRSVMRINKWVATVRETGNKSPSQEVVFNPDREEEKKDEIGENWMCYTKSDDEVKV